ncbi:unnamed protein product [Lampetra fluviatilis]
MGLPAGASRPPLHRQRLTRSSGVRQPPPPPRSSATGRAAPRLPPLLLSLLLLLSLVQPGAQDSFPQGESIRYWARRIENELDRVLQLASGVDQLKQLYKEQKNDFDIEENEDKKLVENVSAEIEKLLTNKVIALKKLTETAETLQKNHQWNDDIKEENVTYFNAKQHIKMTNEGEDEGEEEVFPNQIDAKFETDPAFKRPVNDSYTAVHIPTDIYRGSTIILNELNWTAGLDEVFINNKKEDPTLMWQVFGSATGLTRYYPASEWNKEGKGVDMYDVRRRPWYIQGAASPKDMLILVDVSGSVSGLTLNLIKTSVLNMLETLADDDFVNVVSFNNTANSVACFNHLVQANVRNKNVLKAAVNKMLAKGVTNYTAGLEFAFNQLLNFNNISRAFCNKMIMLFTDGGEDRAQDIFEKYNWPNKTVRVFTFSVGQHNYDVTPIQWMACANKGYYFEIPSIGAIRINTQEYLDVLSRPMVLKGPTAKQVQWTNVYQDALGLGLVITGTMPVFNTSMQGDKQNQLILGVMGVDVSLEDVKRLTKEYILGANGYFFAIDPNGYVFLHPNLLPKLASFSEPVTLDFLDAELENDIKVEIRELMIKGESGTKTFETLIKSLDERYVDKGLRTYTWKRVRETDYSLALVMPSYSLYRIKARLSDDITQAKYFSSMLPPSSHSETRGHVFIAPRKYCKNMKIVRNNTEFLLNFIDEIDNKSPDAPNCEKEWIYNLLLDVEITNRLAKEAWQDLNKSTHGIKTFFVATDSGVTRIYPLEEVEDWDEEPEPYNASYYKRSLDNEGFVYKPVIPIGKGGSYDPSNISILASRAVEVEIDGKVLKPAVVGVKLELEVWTAKFKLLASNHTGEGRSKRSSNCDSLGSCEMDCDLSSKELQCVILDDGGFLIMSNQEDQEKKVGEFFGVVDPSLMRALYNVSLFAKVESYDYQSTCDPEKEQKAGAAPRSIAIPRISDVLNVAWLASAAAWSLLQQLFYSLTFQTWYSAEFSYADGANYKEKVSCITLQTQYYFPNNKTTFQELMDCGNCSRFFFAEKLANSNLVFVVSEKIMCPMCDNRPLIQAEQRSDGPNMCELAPRYRKGPDSCFDYNILEDTSDCGRGSMLQPSFLALVGLQVLALWLFSPIHFCPS